MKLSFITTIVCSLTAGGKLGFAKATGVLVEGGSNPQVLLGQDYESSETPAPVKQALNCSQIQEIWDKDPDVLIGTPYVEIKAKCESGEITKVEEVAAEVEEVLAPNLSLDDQIASIANDICEGLSSGNKTDVDTSTIKAACSAEPRDNDAVVDAASKVQAENTPKDEDYEAELEETCTSIRENRDKIEAALLVLAARSSERRLQDDPDSEAPVSSFEMATDMLGMYDCLCDQSNPDNLGCMKKALKFTEVVSKSMEEQAAEDLNPERILDDFEETIKKHSHYLRHSGQDDINEATLSLARALSKGDESVDVSSSVAACDPPGISRTPWNGGYKLCLYAGNVFECEINWNPYSAGCLTFECGGGGVVQLKAAVSVCFPGPVIQLEIKLCVSVVSEILEAIGRWIPAAESFFNKFNIYSGCYRLAYAEYDVPNQRFYITSGPHRSWMLLNVFVRYGGSAYIRFKGSGCAYSDTADWAMFERTARMNSSGPVYPNFQVASDYIRNIPAFGRGRLPPGIVLPVNPVNPVNPGNNCPFNAGRWVIFQIYIKVELEWIFTTSNVWSFDKYFLAK